MARKSASSKTGNGKKKTGAASGKAASKRAAAATATKESAGNSSTGGKKKPGRYTSSRLHSVDTRAFENDLLVPELLPSDYDDDDDDDSSRRSSSGRGKQVREARERFRDITRRITPDDRGRGSKKPGGVGLGTGIINGIFNRVRQLKSMHPDLATELDLNEWKIKQRLQNIRSLLDHAGLADEDRELFLVLQVNYMQRMCEEILVDPEPHE
ncbi:MAG: hypothetical protein AB7K09_11335 [Planctomycetota bacterium]